VTGLRAPDHVVRANRATLDLMGKPRLFHLHSALAQHVAQALKQGQDLAVKAIESASNVTSFGAVKEIPSNKPRTSPRSKPKNTLSGYLATPLQ
jgi:hypothetical protein